MPVGADGDETAFTNYPVALTNSLPCAAPGALMFNTWVYKTLTLNAVPLLPVFVSPAPLIDA
jgi:hypothetical protein